MLVSADGLRVMRCDPAATVPGAFVRRRIEKRQSSQRWRAARVGFSFSQRPKQTSVVGARQHPAPHSGARHRVRVCVARVSRADDKGLFRCTF